MTQSLAQLRNQLRRRLYDEAGGKLPNTLTGDTFLTDAINQAIYHSRAYVVRDVNATATTTGTPASITLPSTVEKVTELALTSAVTGYPPTPINPSLYQTTVSEAGTTTITFRMPYAASTTVHIKGICGYATLDSDSQETALNADYILHYAQARVYESLANRGGHIEAESRYVDLMEYHESLADKILGTIANNPYLNVPKKGK